MATIEDCTCPVCLYIMIEPVTMPCKHSLCLPCYKQTVEKANLCCPLCRLRISVWARKSAKASTLVDNAKWEAIKMAFPEQVQKRLEGREMLDDDDDDDKDSYEIRLRQLLALSKPGEIREEYEAELQKLQRLREEEAKIEEAASAALIRLLQQEEEKEKEELERLKDEQAKQDREIAAKLQESFVFETDDGEQPGLSQVISENANKSNKEKCKQIKQPPNNLTMNTFFSRVPREAGVISPGCEVNTHGKSHLPSCVGSNKDPVLAAASQAGVVSLSGEASRDRSLPSNMKTIQSPVDPLLTMDVDCVVDACKDNQKHTAPDRFAAGPSGLARSDSVIPVSCHGLKAHLPGSSAYQIPGNRHAASQLMPVVICARLPSTQSSDYQVGEPSNKLLGVAASHESAEINTPTPGLVSSKPGSAKSLLLETDHQMLSSCDSRKRLQSSHEQALDIEGKYSSDQNASLLPDRKNYGSVCEVTVKGSVPSSDSCLDSQQTLTSNEKSQPATLGNLKDTSSSNTVGQARGHSDDNLGQVSNSGTSERVLLYRLKDRRVEYEDSNKKKHSSQVCELRFSEGVCVNNNNNNNDSVDSFCSDTTKCVNEACAENVRCLIPSRSCLVSAETHSKAHFIDSALSSEKENLVQNNGRFDKEKKTSSKIHHDHQMLTQACGKVVQGKTHLVKKSQKTSSSGVVGKKAEPAVSIMKWCVPNSCRREPISRSQTQNKAVVEAVKGSSKIVPDCAGKRRYTSSSSSSSDDDGDDNEMTDHEKQMSGIYNDKKILVKQSEMSTSTNKRIKSDPVVDSSTSVRQETPGGTDDVDNSGISQEEKDHIMALELQKMYSKLDKQRIAVDRFKGSKDHYMLRKKRGK